MREGFHHGDRLQAAHPRRVRGAWHHPPLSCQSPPGTAPVRQAAAPEEAAPAPALAAWRRVRVGCYSIVPGPERARAA